MYHIHHLSTEEMGKTTKVPKSTPKIPAKLLYPQMGCKL